MLPRSAKLREDIRDAATFILQITRDRQRDSYLADRVLRQAVERNFEIIGEALNRLAGSDPGTAARIGDHPRIIAFRNALIHGYDLIDDALVWKVIHEQLPVLADQVSGMLREHDAE